MSFQADGSNALSVPAGTYTVVETPAAGYTASYTNCSGIVLAAGGSATCTIINSDHESPPATLTVSKIVVNDNGGTQAASSFSFSVNGAPAVAFETDGSNVLSVPAGTYSVTEPAVSGYASSLSNCSGIVLAAGDSATCTITNNDIVVPVLSTTIETSKSVYTAGEMVTMTARVSNNGVPVTGAQVNFNALKPNLVNRVILNANTNSSGIATASFVSGTGSSSIGTYQLTVTATSGGLAAQAFASFDVLKNPPTQPATLTVTKMVVNDDGGTRVASNFSFSVNGAAPVAFEADGSNTLNVPAGTYSITEPAVVDYAASLSNCSGLVLAAGGSATCTITNNDQAPSPPATLTVTKVVVNDDGGNRVASDFSFSVNGGAPVAFEGDGSNTLSVPAGSYTITEPAVSGYASSLSGCSGIVLAADESATCTITNNDTAAPVLSATVESSKPTYIRGETVTLTARVLNNGVPVVGAQVNFNALKPNLVNRVILNANTNSSGIATV